MHGLLLAAALQVAASGAEARVAALNEARRLVNAGKPDGALEALRVLPAGDPQAALLRGVAHYHANHPVQAIDALAPAAAKLPEGSLERREAVQILGLASYLAGRIAEAIPYLEQTRQWAEGNPELSYVLGMAYVQTRQADKARDTWARSFGVPPASAAAHLLAAQMMVRAELDELEALKALEKGDLAAAEGMLRQAIGYDPNNKAAHYLLGQLLQQAGRAEEARRELEIAEKLQGNVDR